MVMRDCLYTFIIIILCTSVNINSRIPASSTRNDTLFCTSHENIGESWKTQKDRTFQMHGLNFLFFIHRKICRIIGNVAAVVVVPDRGTDCLLCQHRAVQLLFRQPVQSLCHGLIGESQCL